MRGKVEPDTMVKRSAAGSPGPGSYEVRREIGGKGVSLSGKSKALRPGNEEVPGPGAYSVEAKSSKGKGFSLGMKLDSTAKKSDPPVGSMYHSHFMIMG